MVEPNEADRLRALLSLMREFQVTEMVTPDGYTLRTPVFASPLVAALAASSHSQKDDDDDGDEVAVEERAGRDLRKAWERHWERASRSSGSGVPAYPGDETASRFLGRLA